MPKASPLQLPILEVGVKAFIKNAQGKYLILKRAKPYPGQKICKWDIPGGRINPGEEVNKALKREIKEETGLILSTVNKILAVQDILRVNGRHTVRITYEATCREGNVMVNKNEHTSFRWADLNEIAGLRYDSFLSPVISLL